MYAAGRTKMVDREQQRRPRRVAHIDHLAAHAAERLSDAGNDVGRRRPFIVREDDARTGPRRGQNSESFVACGIARWSSAARSTVFRRLASRRVRTTA